MARDELHELVRTEREALVDLLETLEPEQWRTPSLCAGWSVQDVAAHLAWTPVESPLAVAVALLRSRLRINEYVASSARRWSARGPEAICAQLRANAETGATPLGVPAGAVITDAVVHALDIRRPLGVAHEIAPAAFRRCADFLAGIGWPGSMLVAGGARRRLQGLRLVADGVDWAHGAGAEVRAAPDAVLLVLAGRPVGPGELSGEGVDVLRGRISSA